MFNEEKTTRLALYFLKKAENNAMPYLKLIKLLYLADREMIKRYNATITGDRYVAMKFGPVLSYTLNLIRSDQSYKGYEKYMTEWTDHISTEGYDIRIKNGVLLQDNPLEEQEVACADHVIKNFMEYDQWSLIEYTHEHCKEWIDPTPYRVMDITPLDIGVALGKSDEELDMLFKGV